MSARKAAPIQRDATALVGVLFETVAAASAHGAPHAPLIDRLCRRGLDLHEAIILALAGHDPYERLLDADAALRSLRGLLRLSCDLGLLTRDEFLSFAEQTDTVGRQLGGWLRHSEMAA